MAHLHLLVAAEKAAMVARTSAAGEPDAHTVPTASRDNSKYIGKCTALYIYLYYYLFTSRIALPMHRSYIGAPDRLGRSRYFRGGLRICVTEDHRSPSLSATHWGMMRVPRRNYACGTEAQQLLR